MFGKNINNQSTAALVGRNLKLAWYLFGFGCLFLLIGVGIKLLPVVEIQITPKYENINIDTTVQVDLSLPDIITPIGIVPGRLLNKGEENGLSMSGYNIYETPRGAVAVKKSDLEQSVNRFILKSIPEDQEIISGTEQITWDQPSKITNSNFFNVPVNIKFNSYTLYPLETWRQHLSGLSLTDTEEWLHRQQGIEAIKIIFKPSFLAKIRPKMPNNPKLIKFTLDNGGKTSILQGRSK